MQRVCPHCEYDMSGLPSDRCPECGELYDPALAASLQRRRRRGRSGVQLTDLLLLLAILVAANTHQWPTLGWVVLASGAWVALRWEAMRSGPIALWLAVVAGCAAGALSQRGPQWLVMMLLGLAGAVAIVETLRFGWRVPAAVLKAIGLYLGIIATIAAMIMLARVIVGGGGGRYYLFSMVVEPEGRLDHAVLLCLYTLLAAMACGLWRTGGWLAARSMRCR